MSNFQVNLCINLGIALFFIIGLIIYFKRYTNFFNEKDSIKKYFKDLFDLPEKKDSTKDNGPIKKK